MLKNSRGFAHPILLVILSIVVLGTGYFTYTHIKHSQAVNKEKQLYATLDKQSTDYINAIAAKYPGKISHERYCEYGSAKYGEGSLGCSVRASIDIATNSQQVAQEVETYTSMVSQREPWLFKKSRFEKSIKDIEQAKYLYPQDDSNSCYASIYSGLGWKDTLITFSCSNNALAEHYPVREH